MSNTFQLCAIKLNGTKVYVQNLALFPFLFKFNYTTDRKICDTKLLAATLNGPGSGLHEYSATVIILLFSFVILLESLNLHSCCC